MLSFNQIRKGKIITWEGEPYVVMEADFMRKQKARPVMRTKLKSLRSGATVEHTWQQSDKAEEADMERKSFQFLYKQGETFAFMDGESYEQVELEAKVIADAGQWLRDGQEVTILLYEGKPISVELPIKIERRVVSAPPGVKGDTSTNVMKEVLVEGDVKIKAPLFIKDGDSIRIDTRTGEYVERV